jgi:hypothetical protein
MSAFVVLIGCLGAAGILPALVVARRSPALIFLAPLLGACMAGVAAGMELAAGGSLVTCYLAVAVTVNLAVIAWWLAAGRYRSWPSPPWTWSVLTAITVLGALLIPLTALRAQLIGWDAHSIWITHALMVSGGHQDLFTALRDPAYGFSNPDYPPLVPAVGALAFAAFGPGSLHLAVDMTVLMNACALGVAGTGIAAMGNKGRPLTRIAAIAAAGAICIVGFAVAGKPGIDGYADLMWAAAAVGAIIWGLVLPQSTQALVIAWICAAAASLTKNEGLTTALIVLALIALRYRPLTGHRWQGRHAGNGSRGGAAAWQLAHWWAGRAAFVLVPALPGLAWAGLIRLLGIHDAFFSIRSHESLGYRASTTVTGMAGYLTVVPIVLAVLAAGSIVLRRDRERSRFGNPAWLWTACTASLAIIFATYLFGGYEINGWLRASAGRTTVFAQLLLYAELTIWLVIAIDAACGRADGERLSASPVAAQVPAGVP